MMVQALLFGALQAQIAQLKAVPLSDSSSSSSSTSSFNHPASALAVLPSPMEHDHQHAGVIILSELDAHDRPVSLPSSALRPSPLPSHAGPRKRHSSVVEKFSSGERVAWRDDDVSESKSVLQMVEEERLQRDDDDSRYDDVYAANVAKKGKFAEQSQDDAFDALDSSLGLYQSKRSHMTQQQQADRQREAQRRESERFDDLVSKCELCLTSPVFARSTLIATGVKLMLNLPRVGVVGDGHCLLSTIDHSTSSAEWDEGQHEELLYFKRHLHAMYASPTSAPTHPSRLITVETVIHRKRRRHTAVHCVEVTEEEFADAALVFSKAIEESEGDWAVHRPLITVQPGLTGGVRKVVPGGFPYFLVEFGPEGGGYVHVIEREEKWQEEFGLEVIRGIKGLTSTGGRRGAGGREPRDVELARVARFRNRWRPHDWTQKLTKNSTKSLPS